MLSRKVEEAINAQINREMYSAYLYMAMSAQATAKGLKGFASWFMVQYHEEMVHAMKFYEYVLRQGAKVVLKNIDQPPVEFKSMLDMFEKTLEHEQYVTKSINDLIDLAVSERDHATHAFVSWYVTEQVEEEENATDILQKLRMVGDNAGGMFMLDKEVGMRTLTVPTDFSKGVEAQMGAGA